MHYVGSRTELNDIVGVADVIVLDEILEADYANKVFKPNILIWLKSNKTMYLTDGEKPLSQLDPITVSVADILRHFNDATIHTNMATVGDMTTTLASLEQNKMDKSADSTFVHVSGNETINGIKTFTSVISGDLNGTATKATSDGTGANIVNTYLTKAAANTTYTTKSELADHAADNSLHLTEDIRHYLQDISTAPSVSTSDASAMVSGLYA